MAKLGNPRNRVRPWTPAWRGPGRSTRRRRRHAQRHVPRRPQPCSGRSIAYSSPTSARHLSSTRRLPRLSSQSCLAARIPAGRQGSPRSPRRPRTSRASPAPGPPRSCGCRRADHLNAADAALVARREPKVGDLDPATGAEHPQHVLLASDTEHATSATMPFGNCSTAEAHSSTPVSPRCATPFTTSGSRNGSPAAAPAISRAIDTG